PALVSTVRQARAETPQLPSSKIGDSGGPRRLYCCRAIRTRQRMSGRPYRDIHRRNCRQVHVGTGAVGGGARITVQSMTNTRTDDVKATVNQVRELELAGADIVRVSCPDQESALALKDIVREARVPIVADIHFHYKRAIEAAES